MNANEMRVAAKMKADEAVQAAEAGEVERSEELLAESEALESKAVAIEKATQRQKALKEPVLPADLPEDKPVVVPVETTPEPEDGAFKAFYRMRYGDADEATKAVLNDLHGKDYEAKRWGQWGAFNHYLRYGENGMNREQMKALKEVVLTPEYAAKAIQEGWDIASVKSTMVEAVDTLGGYVVPVDFQARVIERLQGLVVMRGRAFGMTTSRDKVEIPVATGGGSQYSSAVRVTWVDETPTAGTSETNLTFGLEAIPVHTCMAETPLSRNFVEDSAVNIADYLARKFAEAAAIDEDNQFLTGDGNGRPQGLLPSSGNGLSLTEENSGNASALTFDGLIGLTYAIDAQYRQNAAFVAEKATWEAVAKLKDSNGQYLWRDRFGNNKMEGGANAGVLLGYPVLEQEAMPTIASSAYPIIFGDFSGYTIVDRIGMTVERFLDSQTARQNLIYYVMRRRIGGQPTETWRFAVQKVSA